MNDITFVVIGLEKLWWKFSPEYDRLSELFFEAMTLAISSLGGAFGTVLGMIAFSYWIDKKIFKVVLIIEICGTLAFLSRLFGLLIFDQLSMNRKCLIKMREHKLS